MFVAVSFKNVRFDGRKKITRIDPKSLPRPTISDTSYAKMLAGPTNALEKIDSLIHTLGPIENLDIVPADTVDHKGNPCPSWSEVNLKPQLLPDFLNNDGSLLYGKIHNTNGYIGRPFQGFEYKQNYIGTEGTFKRNRQFPIEMFEDLYPKGIHLQLYPGHNLICDFVHMPKEFYNDYHEKVNTLFQQLNERVAQLSDSIIKLSKRSRS